MMNLDRNSTPDREGQSAARAQRKQAVEIRSLHSWERIVAVTCGVAFLVGLVIIAILLPHPTAFQFWVFRVVLALAAGAFVGVVGGFIELNSQIGTFALRAGGGLAVFLVVYNVNPPVLEALGVEVPTGSGFEVYSHDRKLDLSLWQFVPDGHASEKVSKSVWRDKLKIRRKSNDAKSFVLRHATSGVPDPTFFSGTHHCTPTETVEKPIEGPRPKLRIFDVACDVSGEPLQEWFELELTAEYWNAFNNPDQAWAGTPVIHPTKQVVFEIRFPANKPVRTWERREGERDTTRSELITDDAIEISEDRTILRWRIDRPTRNWVYKFVWEW